MAEVRAALSHVLWLGGAPRAGKTTLATLLAGKYDLKLYNLDWHYWREHQDRLDPARHPVSVRWKGATMDEWWVDPSVDEIVERAVALWNETFDLVVEDLIAESRSRVILAEGPGAFPWRVAPLLAAPTRAIFLVPTPAFRDAAFASRLRGRQFGGETRDPERARANHRAHDVALAARIASACADLGLRCIDMGGTRDLAASLGLIEAHFRPHLPEALNV